MKKIEILICLSFFIVILCSSLNEGIQALATEAASIDNQSAVEVDPAVSTGVEQTSHYPETFSDNDGPDQNNESVTSFKPNNENHPLSETSWQQSAPKESDLRSINTATDTTTENIVLNSLPEITKPQNPDTLAKVIQWWSANPLKMKLWYLFLTISIVVFLCGKTSFRKPLLFINLVVFGFYLGNTVNPINSIFSLPVQTGGKFVDSLVLVGIPIILSLFVGRFFCGWACPIGAAQEFIHPENLKLRFPSLLDRVFSYFRFLLLFGGILLSWSAMSNLWNNYDPFHILFTFKGSFTATGLLIIVMIGSILIERFFCRYLCPLGAILTITSRFSLLKMRPDSDACIACGKCSQPEICSMNMISSVNPYTDVPTIESSECIICHRCANICRYSAIRLSFLNKRKSKSYKTQSAGPNISS